MPVNLATAERCPKCGTNWLAERIPEKDRESYGGATHFRRVIALYDLERDTTVAWKCPDCGEEFPR